VARSSAHETPRIKKTVALLGFLSAEQAGTVVEFALVGGLILTPLLLGILEFGFAAWSKNSVTADAREGARYAIVRGSSSSSVATADSVRSYVRSRTALDTLGPDSIRVYAVWPTNNSPGSMVHVSVAHRVRRLGVFIPTHTDSATSKMVILF
jgi:Flp pilus assembly protein TadG